MDSGNAVLNAAAPKPLRIVRRSVFAICMSSVIVDRMETTSLVSLRKLLGLRCAFFTYAGACGRKWPRAVSYNRSVAMAWHRAYETIAPVPRSPAPSKRVIPGCYVPIFVFELVMGFWLLFKGLRPANAARSTESTL
jgi:hypothetical protein